MKQTQRTTKQTQRTTQTVSARALHLVDIENQVARAAGLKVTIVSNAHQAPHWRVYVAGSRHLTVDIPQGTRRAVA